MEINWKFVGLYAAYVIALHAIDGPWRRWKEGRAGKAVDPWTYQHLMWGVIAQRMGLSRNQFMLLGVANEVVETGVRTFRPDLLWGSPESPANVAVDLAANLAGWEASKALLGPRR